MEVNMKKLAITIIFMAAVIGTVQAGEESWFQTPPAGMIRGVVNVCTSPLEIVRGPVYWTQSAFNHHPQLLGIDGAIWGITWGSAMTVLRMSAGLVDFFIFGIPGNYLHGDIFPEFFWEALWRPESLDE